MSEVINESRRNFLRLAVAAPLGIVAGSALYPATEAVGVEIEEHTGLQTGNASTRHELDAACASAENRLTCAADRMENPAARKKAVIGGPIIEEMSFRALPSLVTDLVAPSEGDTYTTPPETVLWGNGNPKLSRKEMIVGAATSLLFSYAHNIDNKGMDLKTVPIQSMLGGGVLWYLQRKLGFASNLSAHVAYNNWWTLGFRSGRSH